MFTHTKQKRVLAPKDLKTIAGDLSKAFGWAAVDHFETTPVFGGGMIDVMERPPFDPDRIEKVIVITWANMFFTGNTKTRLVSTFISYSLFYLKKLSRTFFKVF